jgi:hypothetical protein
MMRAILAVTVVLTLLGLGCTMLACSGAPPTDGANATVGGSSGGSTWGSGACETPNTGCACANEGQLVQCGEVSGRTSDGHPTCAMGYRRCENAQWTSCEMLQNVTPKPASADGLHFDNNPIVPEAGCPNPCDPYCLQTVESPDGGWVDETGVGSAWDAAGDAPSDVVLGLLAEGGKSFDGGIYHQMKPGDVAINPVDASTTLNSVDVYFLFNSTTSMQTSITQLATQLPNVVSSIQATIPNVAFGDGRFTNYEAWPYGSQQQGNVVYENRTNISTNAALTTGDVTTMKNNASTLFVNTPYIVAQSTTPALFSMASNQQLQGWVDFTFPGSQPADWWWNVTKYYGEASGASLLSPFFTSSAACNNGGAGAPCFRPNAYHVVMLLQDAPLANGPGGSFPYYQFKPQYFPWNSQADYTTENSWYWYQSTSLGASPPNMPTSEGATQAATIPNASVGKPLIFTGNVKGLTSLQVVTSSTQYVAGAQQTCTLNGNPTIGSGPDAAFDFTVPAAGTRYWFDTSGSSYDTVLYLIDKSTGNLMGCNDDALAWLSAVDITASGVPNTDRNIGQKNSALVGFLPAGNYRLVLDKFDNTAYPTTSSNTGIYQLNMWPNIDDPKLAGNPHGSGVTTPSYNQMLSALQAPGVNALVTSIEMSGLTCGQTVASWERAWTRWSLEQLATDTGAVVNGKPSVYSVQQNGTPGPVQGNSPLCPQGSNLGSIISSDIANITGNLAQPITAIAVDYDDLTDFDGTTNVNAGPLVLTPTNIDDSTFVTSIVAQPTTGCTGPSANTFQSCGPGTQPNFQVNFAVPASVTLRANPQIFQFRIEIHGVNNQLLGTTPVTIVVPPTQNVYVPTDYTRDFAASCPNGTKAVWGVYSWTTTTPADSSVQFFATAAATQAALNTTTELSPAFGSAQAMPNTQIGAADVGAFLQSKNVPMNTGFLRVRSHVSPSSDGTKTPTLSSYSLGLDCVPSE